MIEDVAGATSEPTRRRHVAVLSAAVAAVSLVLLVALIVPAIPSASPQASAPSAGATSMMTVVSGPTRTFQSDQLWLGVEPGRITVCVGDYRDSPSEGDRQVSTVPLDTGNSWLSVPCAASTTSVPRIFAWGPTTANQSDQWWPFIDPSKMTVCVDESLANSPYYVVSEGNRHVITVPVDTRIGWHSVPCTTSTISVPRIDRAR